MQKIMLREPCYAQEPGTDIKHLQMKICKKLFGWESACQSLEILLKDEVPDVEFYAVVSVQDEGLTLAATGELGAHHYFIPWTNIIAIHGQVTT